MTKDLKHMCIESLIKVISSAVQCMKLSSSCNYVIQRVVRMVKDMLKRVQIYHLYPSVT